MVRTAFPTPSFCPSRSRQRNSSPPFPSFSIAAQQHRKAASVGGTLLPARGFHASIYRAALEGGRGVRHHPLRTPPLLAASFIAAASESLRIYPRSVLAARHQ